MRAVHWAPEGAERTLCGQVIDRHEVSKGQTWRPRRMARKPGECTCEVCRRKMWRYE